MKITDFIVGVLIASCVVLGFLDERKKGPYRGVDPVRREADRLRWN